MSWNYRVVRREIEDVPCFGIHEAYYESARPDLPPRMISKEPIEPHGETFEELVEDLKMQLLALEKPVLNYEDFDEGN